MNVIYFIYLVAIPTCVRGLIWIIARFAMLYSVLAMIFCNFRPHYLTSD
ncbi:hypothetical protein yrohd0001_34470 [Yersinia rohdei ATCC 43380]|nr:hypothetical protein yrohd0001_34470 [Yersinia rohdei ATCC 43380]